MKSYNQQLAWEMQVRSVSDDLIREAVSEVRDVEATGSDPLAAFGPPQEYAKTFPISSSKKRAGRFWPTLGGMLAVSWIIGTLIVVRIFDLDPAAGVDTVALWPALLIMILSLGVGFLAWRKKASSLAR